MLEQYHHKLSKASLGEQVQLLPPQSPTLFSKKSSIVGSSLTSLPPKLIAPVLIVHDGKSIDVIKKNIANLV
jgi:hypothetical protein